MKNLYKISFIILLFFLNNAMANIENKIILKVENEIITNFDVKNKILSSLIVTGEEINQANINKYKKEILNILIDNKLKKIEVTKYDIKRNDLKINSYLDQISINKDVIKSKFLKNGLDFQSYLDDLSIEFMWQDLILKIYSKKISIDENVIEKEINDFLGKSSDIEEFKISKVEFPLNSGEKYKDKIIEIQKEIKDYGFEITAAKYRKKNISIQTDNLGWISSKALSSDIYEILKDTKIGEITRPIEKQNTIMFLKLNDKKISTKENVDISNLKKNIISQKRNEQFNLYSKSYLSKLRNNSLIEYK